MRPRPANKAQRFSPCVQGASVVASEGASGETMASYARVLGIVFAVLSLGVFPNGAALAAEDCKPLTLITSVDLLRRDGDPHVYVPVTINGHQKLMMLDTGGWSSEVTSQAAADLGLPYVSIRYSEVNLAGEESHQAASVDSFTIGQLTTKSVEFVVSPEKVLFHDEPEFVGILAPNILKNYDIDIDFGSNKLSILSPDHCEGKVIYWPADSVAVVPMHVLRSGHILVPVELDGKEVNAIFDTGTSTTTLMMPIAEDDFGLKMGSADTRKTAEMPDRPGTAIYEHKFTSLNFGGVSVSNLTVAILPDFLRNKVGGPQLGSRLGSNGAHEQSPDMLIGMNVLRHLHVYIAYREQKLYITQVDGEQAIPVANGTTPNTSPYSTHLRLTEERRSGL
jgi:predicted aspartyl protease